MKNKKTYKNLKLILYLVSLFLIFFYLILNDFINYSEFVGIEFLFTFIGVFIGFSISLYTYITSMFDKLILKNKERYSDNVLKIKEKENILIDVHSGIKDDINFMIVSLFIIVILNLSENFINIILSEYYYADCIIPAIYMTIFTLTIFAIRDIIKIAFVFSDFLIKKEGKEKK